MIVINFKTYPEGSGENAEKLAGIISEVSEDTKLEIVCCPQAVDLKDIVKITKTPVWTQHVDPVEQKRNTGWFPPAVAKQSGAVGTLLNHSEHKLTTGALSETLNRCRQAGLKTLVFADSVNEAAVVAKFKPDFIGYEPSELVGSTQTSVAEAKPEIIKEVVEAVKPTPVLAGAGVHSQRDVEVSLDLGAVGVAVATDVVKAQDPKKELQKLANGFK
jgi:triosephosphate isomerase